MNHRFIQGVQIRWDKVDEYSYLRRIPALQFEDNLVLTEMFINNREYLLRRLLEE